MSAQVRLDLDAILASDDADALLTFVRESDRRTYELTAELTRIASDRGRALDRLAVLIRSDGSRLLTADEAARRLGRKRSWIASLPDHVIAPARVYVPARGGTGRSTAMYSDRGLDEWIDQQRGEGR